MYILPIWLSFSNVNFTLCILRNFLCFLSTADFFFKIIFFFEKMSFKNNSKVSKSLDPHQARYSIGLDLEPNCLTRCWYSRNNFWKKLIL